jgi:hypothetical protein
VILAINGDYFPKQHYPVGLRTGDTDNGDYDVTSLGTQAVTDVPEESTASILRTSFLHDVTFHKTAIFLDPVVRNSNFA